MRHRKRKPKLGRTTSHREAMLGNMVTSLIQHQRIRTTQGKAAAARRLADRMITLGKRGDLSARRRAFSILRDRSIVKILFDEVAPLYKDRNGGYTRVLTLDTRPGDGAQMSLLELVEKRTVEPKTPRVKKEKKAKEKEVPEAAQPVAPEKEAPKKPKEKAVPKPAEPAKKEPKGEKKKHVPKQAKPGLFNKLRNIFRRPGGS